MGLIFGISLGFLFVNRGVFCITMVRPVIPILESLDTLSSVEKGTHILYCVRPLSLQPDLA